MTEKRRPRRPSRGSWGGIQGAKPTTFSTDGSEAASIATAPPIEKPSRNIRSPPTASIAARASSTHKGRRRQDLTR